MATIKARIRPKEFYLEFEGFDGEGTTLEEAMEDLKKNMKEEDYELGISDDGTYYVSNFIGGN